MSDTVESGVDSSTESILQKAISDFWPLQHRADTVIRPGSELSELTVFFCQDRCSDRISKFDPKTYGTSEHFFLLITYKKRFYGLNFGNFISNECLFTSQPQLFSIEC